MIGNPPYVEYSKVKKKYKVHGFSTEVANNLYAFTIERSLLILTQHSYCGMIIPLSAYCTDRMECLQQFQIKDSSSIWISNYAERPSKLFEGAERNLSIVITRKREVESDTFLYTTYYYKWYTEFREQLFNSIEYIESKACKVFGIIPKISSRNELTILSHLRVSNKAIGNFISSIKTKHILYYRNSGGRYWKIITNFQPTFYLNNKKGISSRESYLYFNDSNDLSIIISILNSALYYWYYIMHSDARTNNPSDLKSFPIDLRSISSNNQKKLIVLCNTLMEDLKLNSIMTDAQYRTGDVRFRQFFPQKSKPIIDEIDKVLASHYGFTEEELDFIINYDIKYRMGKESAEADNLEEE